MGQSLRVLVKSPAHQSSQSNLDGLDATSALPTELFRLSIMHVRSDEPSDTSMQSFSTWTPRTSASAPRFLEHGILLHQMTLFGKISPCQG